MKQFDLNAVMADMHQTFPVAQRRPVIGITGNYGDLTCKLGEGYYKQVVAAGGVPFIIPPVADEAVLVNALNQVDAVLLSGGADINPLYQGEDPVPQLGGINSERDLPELLLARLAFNRQLPMLGICRGIHTSVPISNIRRMPTARSLRMLLPLKKTLSYIKYIMVVRAPHYMLTRSIIRL